MRENGVWNAKSKKFDYARNGISYAPVDGQNEVRNKDGEVIDVFTWFDHENNPSLTQQQYQKECDINVLMDRYSKGQDISGAFRPGGAYGDFTQFGDYRDAQDRIIQANEEFMKMDPKLRQRFSNDPHELIEFLKDERNYDEAVRLGVIVPKPEVQPSDADRIVEAIKSSKLDEK